MIYESIDFYFHFLFHCFFWSLIKWHNLYHSLSKCLMETSKPQKVIWGGRIVGIKIYVYSVHKSPVKVAANLFKSIKERMWERNKNPYFAPLSPSGITSVETFNPALFLPLSQHTYKELCCSSTITCLIATASLCCPHHHNILKLIHW